MSIDTDSWRFLDDLLMSPLDAAVPLKQVDGIPVHVPEHLNLHMSAHVHDEDNPKVTLASTALQ